MPKIKMKRKLLFIMLIFIVILLALLTRTGYIQIVRGEQLQQEAFIQQTKDKLIPPKRGSILDRNYKVLAESASVHQVSATPKQLEENEEKKSIKVDFVAKGLSDILGLEYENLLKKLQNTKSNEEIVKRRVESEDIDRVRSFIDENNVKGIYITPDTKRYYPNGKLASQVIGFTGTDNQGLEGIEAVYDDELKGIPGRIVTTKKANNTEMPFKYQKSIEAQDGNSVVLTIDETIQYFTENHLETAYIENGLAAGAAAIVMDIRTSEILAMATTPGYDLNSPRTIEDPTILEIINALEGEERSTALNNELRKSWRNKAVADSYEPGSTFKILTTAMALEEGVVKLDDTFTCTGSKIVGPHKISCWKTSGHGTQTFVEGVQNSCNPVFMEVAARLGADKFKQYFAGFGFTSLTGIELYGESKGVFHNDATWNFVSLATSSFGQTFTITPLQLISAIAAVANNGMLNKPRVVKQLLDGDGNIVKEYPTEFVRQIISPETSKLVCEILESVVSQGTGKRAYIKGFRVAGKTGTSEKLPRDNGKYIASFAGFAPADDPQVVVLVLLDEPTGEYYYGGTIASPVARAILDDTLNYLNVQPIYTEEELKTIEVQTPSLTNMTIDQAKALAAETNLRLNIVGDGENVAKQRPRSGTMVNQQSIITIYTDESAKPVTVTAPNVLNMSYFQAKQTLDQSNLNIKASGGGADLNEGGIYAYKQFPAPGTEVDVGTVITVQFGNIDVGD